MRPVLLLSIGGLHKVLFLPALLGLVVLAGLAVFFWKRDGPGSGRVFGNRIAAHIGMPKHLFHALLDNGVGGSSRERLAALEKRGLGLHAAGVELAPTLRKGLERLENRFGPQEMYDKARPIVDGLVAESEHVR